MKIHWKRYGLSFVPIRSFSVFFGIGYHHFSGAMYLIVGTPLKNYLPGYLKTETRVKIMDNALRIDSLNQAMQLNDAYLKNLTNILTGNVKIDSIRNIKDSLLSFPD